MTTIADLLRAQQDTDVLITRACRAHLGFVVGTPGTLTLSQIRLLHRMQTNSNQRLEALVERMETANATTQERREEEGAPKDYKQWDIDNPKDDG